MSESDFEIFPIFLDDDEDFVNNNEESEYSPDASDEREDTESEVEREERLKSEEKPKALMTLRQRRLNKSLATINNLNNVNAHVAKVNALNLKVNITRAHGNWLKAIRKAKTIHDPWSDFKTNELETEECIRHRYNPHKKSWVKDEVRVKIEKQPFNRGAMRQCFRLKKLSTFTHSHDWCHAMNYVAKHYIEVVDRDVYFQDVKLQMDAKVWGEEYNRHNPPKKVDIFQMYILEFKNRKGSPLYHLEHFIEGNYVKYNSNSGFVDENSRYTPQAFSHFTFERSGHQLIVVDIQGVGDLYTDPQIHTIDGKEYNDGNLGAKGMALFFHSHICNEICHSLDLTEFDLSANELTMHKDFLRKQRKSLVLTRIRGVEEHCLSLSPSKEGIDITRFLERQRSSSSMFSDSAIDSPTSPSADEEPMSCDSPIPSRVRFVSESDSSASMTVEEERLAFQKMALQKARPSCVALEKDFRQAMNMKIGDSILGKVHHEMAKYHEVGRFIINGERSEDNVDWESAVFHEEHAADLGELEAIVTMAKLHLALERDVLVNCTVQESDDNFNRGIDYMMEAAVAGDRGAMLFMARAFETGDNLGTKREISWEDAFHWYDEALNKNDMDEGGEFDSTMNDPPYQLMAKQAELLRQGGHGLDKDSERAGNLYNEAAEAAMAAMKGRLANKYFALAEECYGEMDEEE